MARRIASNNLRRSANDIFNQDNNPFQSMYSQSFVDHSKKQQNNTIITGASGKTYSQTPRKSGGTI